MDTYLLEAVATSALSAAQQTNKLLDQLQNVSAAKSGLDPLVPDLWDLRIQLERLGDSKPEVAIPVQLHPPILSIVRSCGDALAQVDRRLNEYTEFRRIERLWIAKASEVGYIKGVLQTSRQALMLALEAVNLSGAKEIGADADAISTYLDQNRSRVLSLIQRTIERVQADEDRNELNSTLKKSLDDTRLYVQSLCRPGPRGKAKGFRDTVAGEQPTQKYETTAFHSPERSIDNQNIANKHIAHEDIAHEVLPADRILSARSAVPKPVQGTVHSQATNEDVMSSVFSTAPSLDFTRPVSSETGAGVQTNLTVPTTFGSIDQEILSNNSSTKDDDQYSDVGSAASHVDQYVDIITRSLLRDLSPQDLLTVELVLPSLLKECAIRIGHEEDSASHREMMFFAHKHHMKIAAAACHPTADQYRDEPQSEASGKTIESRTIGGEFYRNTDNMDNWLSASTRQGGDLKDPHEEAESHGISFQEDNLVMEDDSVLRDNPVMEEDSLMEDNTLMEDSLVMEDTPRDGTREAVLSTETIRSLVGYKWLVAAIRRNKDVDTSSSQALGHRTAVLKGLESIKTEPQLTRISRYRSPASYATEYDIPWDLVRFLQEQEYDSEVSPDMIGRVITITGDAEFAEALSCKAYMEQMWPLIGGDILGLLEDMIRFPGQNRTVTLQDKTLVSGSIREGQAHVEAVGTKYGLAEVAELLMWVSTALHVSRRDGTQKCKDGTSVYLNSCQMDVRTGAFEGSLHIRASHVGQVKVTAAYETRVLDYKPPLSETTGYCWHRLFRTCEITAGYPIRVRKSGQPGLGIPLDMMADLIRAERVMQFGLNLVIWGFSSLLYATGYQDGIITWHLVCNEDGTQVSPSDHRVPFVASPNKLLPSLNDVGLARHVVGWTSNARNLTGSIDATYVVKSSRLSRPGPDFAMERLQITAGQFITMSTSFIRGYREKPIQVEEKNYSIRLMNIGNRYFVLHDSGVRKAWLVDGLSTVLHLLRSYLAEASKPNDYSSTFLNPCLKPISGGSSRGAAYNTLTHDANLKLRIHKTNSRLSSSASASAAGAATNDEYSGVISIQDRTEAILHILEQICAHHEDRREDRSIGSRIKALPEDTLVGFDFKDVANITTDVFPKAIELSSGGRAWVGLTRAIHAPVLFGRDFGELLRPTVPHEVSCMKDHWNGLSPIGQDTLAVSLVELRRIAGIEEDEEISTDIPLHLVDEYFLEMSAELFSKCSWIAGHHQCKERLTRISQRRSHVADGRLATSKRTPSQLWGKLGRFRRIMSHSTLASSPVIVVPNEAAVLLGQKRLRRQKLKEVPKQSERIEQKNMNLSQASSSRYNTTESRRGSEKLSSGISPLTDLTQSTDPIEQNSAPSSYHSAKSQCSLDCQSPDSSTNMVDS